MGVTTKDYVKYAEKAGRVQYVAAMYRPIVEDDSFVDNEWGASRTFPNLGLLKAWLRKELPKLGPEWHANITHGCWRVDEFYDHQYGQVRDASWDIDYDHGGEAWQEDGDVAFDEW